jgi:hypothetical protein
LTASLTPSKTGSLIGPNPTMLYADYAQLLKSLCLVRHENVFLAFLGLQTSASGVFAAAVFEKCEVV